MTSSRASVGANSLLALALIATAVGTAMAVDLIARNRSLAARIEARDLERFKDNDEFFLNRGNFVEFEDRLLVDEIPNADYARGGVYFFGSSNLKWALKTWELPADIRPLVGNYGIGAVSHALEFQFIRFLVEEKGLLKAGGDRTHVVLGAFWSNALNWRPEDYFGPLWRRHELYTYSVQDGIHVRSMPSIERRLLTERARCSGFIGGNFNRIARMAMTSLGLPIERTEQLKDPAEVRDWVSAHYGAIDWRKGLTDQMGALDALLGYLQDRGVGVTVVLLPYRRAFDDLPLTIGYHDELTDLCMSRSVELVDLSHFLSEDKYADINHFNFQGLGKTHAALMQVAAKHLARIASTEPAR